MLKLTPMTDFDGEMAGIVDQRIIRPSADYTGPKLRQVLPIAQHIVRLR